VTTVAHTHPAQHPRVRAPAGGEMRVDAERGAGGGQHLHASACRERLLQQRPRHAQLALHLRDSSRIDYGLVAELQRDGGHGGTELLLLSVWAVRRHRARPARTWPPQALSEDTTVAPPAVEKKVAEGRYRRARMHRSRDGGTVRTDAVVAGAATCWSREARPQAVQPPRTPLPEAPALLAWCPRSPHDPDRRSSSHARPRPRVERGCLAPPSRCVFDVCAPTATAVVTQRYTRRSAVVDGMRCSSLLPRPRPVVSGSSTQPLTHTFPAAAARTCGALRACQRPPRTRNTSRRRC
jgi:hypothetical protein